jgi:hypothetical protein
MSENVSQDDAAGKVPALTKDQAAILSAYTGFLCGNFSDLHRYAEKVLGRPIWTHQFPSISEELHLASKADFLAICAGREAP